MKIKNILVPIDFSDLSVKALQIANHICEAFDAKITLFHAYIPVADVDGLYYMGMGVGTQTPFEDIEPSIKDRLKQIGGEHLNKKYIADTVVGIGNPSHAINEAASDKDLVIMTTHGRTGFTRLLLGSTTEKVLRTSHTPVLAVEKASDFAPLKRMMVTTDFSEHSYAAFPYANAIASAYGARIDLVHVMKYDEYKTMGTASTSSEARKEHLAKLVDAYFSEIKDQVRTEVILTSESPHEALFNLDFSRDYNLIVMSTIGRTGLDYLTLGSTTANVVRHVDTAVLSVNPRDELARDEE
jgi:nucleotide-binding universal stress UspA family protein